MASRGSRGHRRVAEDEYDERSPSPASVEEPLVAMTPDTPPVTDGSADDPPFSGFAYFVMAFLGFGVLTPWNIFVLAFDFFDEIYPGENVEFYLPAANLYVQLPMALLLVRFGNLASAWSRIVYTFVLTTGLVVIIPFIAGPSIWITFGMAFILGITTSIVQSSVFGYAALFPPIYSQAVSTGIGASGVLTSAIKILTKAFVSNDAGVQIDFGQVITNATSQNTTHTEKYVEVPYSTITYFSVAAVLILGCAAVFVVFDRSAYAHHYTDKAEATKGDSERRPLRLADALDGDDVEATGSGARGSTGHSHAVNGSSKGATSNSAGDSGAPAAAAGGFGVAAALRVLSHMWLMVTCLFLVYAGTFVVFPGVVTEIPFFGKEWPSAVSTLGANKHSWWSVVLLAEFNVFDFIGRSLPAKLILFNHDNVIIPTILRMATLPVMILLSLSKIQSDVCSFIIMALMAVTNGYCSTLTLIYGPPRVPEEIRELSGIIIGTTIQAGILGGSLIALGVK